MGNMSDTNHVGQSHDVNFGLESFSVALNEVGERILMRAQHGTRPIVTELFFSSNSAERVPV